MNSHITCIILFNDILSCLQVKGSIKSGFLSLGTGDIWSVPYSMAGCLAPFLASTDEITAPLSLPHSCNNQKCLQTLPNVPGDIENHCIQSNQFISLARIWPELPYSTYNLQNMSICTCGKATLPVSAALWVTLTTSHRKRLKYSPLLPYHTRGS